MRCCSLKMTEKIERESTQLLCSYSQFPNWLTRFQELERMLGTKFLQKSPPNFCRLFRLRPHRSDHADRQARHHLLRHRRDAPLPALPLKHRRHPGHQLQVDLLPAVQVPAGTRQGHLREVRGTAGRNFETPGKLPDKILARANSFRTVWGSFK